MSDIVNSSLKSAVKGASFVFLGMAGSIFAWFLTKVLIVRSTTIEEFGLYALVVTAVSVVALLATLGIPEGIARYVSVFIGEGKKSEADAISRAALRIGIICGAAAFILFYFSSGLVARHVFYKPALDALFRAVALFVPFYVIAYVLGGILRGHGIIGPKVYYLDVGQPLYFLMALGVFFVLGLPFIWVIYAYVIAMAAVLVSIGSYSYKKIGLGSFSLQKGAHGGELLRFSLPVNISTMSTLILVWTDTLMLGRYTGAESVGLYNIAISLARLLTAPLIAIEFVFMPLAGEMHGKGQSGELNRTYQVLTKWGFSLTLPVFFILIVFPEMTISFLFGERFGGAAESLRVLAACFMFHTMMGANTILLLVLGMSKAIMNVAIVTAFLNLALNYILIKQMGYGIMGAAIATLVSHIAMNVIASIILYRTNGIQPFTRSYMRPLAGSALAGLFVYGIAKLLPLYFWMLPIYFALFAGGYLFSLFLTRSFDREDIALLEAVSARTGLRMNFLIRLLNRFVGRQV